MKRRWRWLLGAGAAGSYLGANAALGGLRGDHVWLAGAGLAAWLAPARARPVARFFAPLLLSGVVYDAQRHWAEAWRGTVHVAEPLAWELAWFGIRDDAGALITPAAWWQAHTHPWLDALAGASYLLFIPGFMAIAAWWRFGQSRREAQDAVWAMFWLNLAGYVTYLFYAAAPPWYVDRYGPGPAHLAAPPEAAGAARFDALLGVSWFAEYYGRNTNVFGAIPSLHVGLTFLAVLYAWGFRSLRIATLAFWVLVTFASVYLNHHYLVDGVVGTIYAVLVWLALTAWRRRAACRT